MKIATLTPSEIFYSSRVLGIFLRDCLGKIYKDLRGVELGFLSSPVYLQRDDYRSYLRDMELKDMDEVIHHLIEQVSLMDSTDQFIDAIGLLDLVLSDCALVPIYPRVLKNFLLQVIPLFSPMETQKYSAVIGAISNASSSSHRHIFIRVTKGMYNLEIYQSHIKYRTRYINSLKFYEYILFFTKEKDITMLKSIFGTIVVDNLFRRIRDHVQKKRKSSVCYFHSKDMNILSMLLKAIHPSFPMDMKPIIDDIITAFTEPYDDSAGMMIYDRRMQEDRDILIDDAQTDD